MFVLRFVFGDVLLLESWKTFLTSFLFVKNTIRGSLKKKFCVSKFFKLVIIHLNWRVIDLIHV